MTPDELRARLKALEITLGEFASVTGLALSTVCYWGKQRPGSGVAPVPQWVGLLLEAWERERLPALPV